MTKTENQTKSALRGMIDAILAENNLTKMVEITEDKDRFEIEFWGSDEELYYGSIFIYTDSADHGLGGLTNLADKARQVAEDEGKI